MRTIKAVFSWSAATALVICVCGPARADFQVNLFNPTIVYNGPSTVVSYSLDFAPRVYSGTTDRLIAGDYLSMYDIAPGLLSTAIISAPANLSFSMQSIGISTGFPPGSYPNDSPDILNLTFTYTGAPITTSSTFRVSATLPGIYIFNPLSGVAFGTSHVGDNGRLGYSHIYRSLVLSPVPEPSTWALFAVAGAVRVIRRRSFSALRGTNRK